MSKERRQIQIPTGNATRFPGISKDAKKLGCTRQHLWYVLTGKRKNQRILNDYVALGPVQKLVAKLARN